MIRPLQLLVGIFYSPEIGNGSSRDDLADYIDRDKLDYLASTGGTATTRVRFQARVDMRTGQPVIEGYHTPADSGMPPIYIMLDSPRNASGVVTGQGETIFGTWLRDAGSGLGCPVPAQIADKLRGREFANFDQFRKAFWTEVSKDTELLSQFKPGNQGLIKRGLSPYAIPEEQAGDE